MKWLGLLESTTPFLKRLKSNIKYKNIFLILFLFLWSGIFVFFRYNQIPHALALDELEFAKLALLLDRLPFPTVYSTFATGHPTLYFYIINIFFKLLGFSNQVLRLPSALASVFSIAMFYLILKKLDWETKFAFFAALILASSRWFYQFGRFAFEGTSLIFLELVTLYFLLGFLKERNWKNLIFTAIFSGLCFYSYTPGRLFFLLPILLIFANNYIIVKLKIKYLAVFLTVFIILISPLIIQIRQVGDERVQSLSIFGRQDINLGQKVMHIWVNGGKLALMWHTRGDTNARHNYYGKPALNKMAGGLFLIGLVSLLLGKRNKDDVIWRVWFLVGLLPSLLVTPSDNPHFLRTLPLVIPTVILITKGFMSIESTGKKIGEKLKLKKLWLKSGLITFFCLVILTNALWDGRTYFKFQRSTHRDAFRIRIELSDFADKSLPPTDAMITEFLEMYGDE